MDYIQIGQIILAIISPILALYGIYKKYLTKPAVKLASPLLDFSDKELSDGFTTPNWESAYESFNSIPLEVYNDDENRVCTIRQCFLEECFSWFRLINWLKIKFKELPEIISLPLLEKLPVDLKPKSAVTLRIDMNEAQNLAHRYRGKLTRLVVKHSRGTVKSTVFNMDEFLIYNSCVAKSFSTVFIRDTLLNAVKEKKPPTTFFNTALDVMKKLSFTELYAAMKIVSVVEEESKVRKIPEEFLILAKMRYEKMEEFYKVYGNNS
jgi:hypothetical protein